MMLRKLGGGLARSISRAGKSVRLKLFPSRDQPALYEGSVLDDFLWARPFNLAMRVVHAAGRRRPLRSGGVSVVVVNWNTCEILKDVLTAVRRHSPDDIELIVVDNGSTDGSREWLRNQSLTTRRILLPFNIGHGRGLDLGVAVSRSPIIVTLDSDAFPFSDDWLPVLTDALGSGNVPAAGMWGRRDRLHPACSAMRRDAYYQANMSFENHAPWQELGEHPEFGHNSWDTGELLFERLGRESVIILATEPSSYGGTTMASVVYHHEQMTTVQTDAPPATARSRRLGWDRAVEALLHSQQSGTTS